MSPGGTMMRVYDTLKTRVVTGGFRPGERLDPARLARALGASATPVREALHQLSGEGLVDSLTHEGFRQPQISEMTIRDRYEWSAELLGIVLQAAFRHGVRGGEPRALPEDYGDAVAALFHRMALLSPNHEHRDAIDRLNDRSIFLRRAEAATIPDAHADMMSLAAMLGTGDQQGWFASIEAFHRKRMRAITPLSIWMRDNSGSTVTI